VTAFWLEITSTAGTRREPLGDGRTRIGAGAVEIALDGVGDDRLELAPHGSGSVVVRFLGAGVRPRTGGEPFEERTFELGQALEWAGHRFALVGEAPREAALEELAPAAPDPGRPDGGEPRGATLSAAEERTWTRLRAGLVVDLGLADRRVVKRWQSAVVEGDFDVDRCAREVLDSARTSDGPGEPERAGRLLRDFLMAPLTRGLRGAGRSLRSATRGGAAMLVSQALALAVYSLLVAIAMVFLRTRGVSFDGLCDRLLEMVGVSTGGGG
jgi:hypothetical protein